MLTEVPEMFGAESILFERCESEEVFGKAVKMIEDFKHYFTSHNQVVYERGGSPPWRISPAAASKRGAAPRWWTCWATARR